MRANGADGEVGDDRPTTAGPVASRPKVLVIAGWERSGSTILANVLGSAPGVVTVGEVNNLWERGFGADLSCACGEPFSRCELWAPVAAAAFTASNAEIAARAKAITARMGNTWLVRRQLPLLRRGQAGRGRPYAELLAPLYQAVADHTGARLLVDASKSPWHALVASELAGFDVSVLHLVRDPRGVAHSLHKKVRYDRDDERSIYMDRHSATKSSLAWVYRGRLIERTWASDRRLRFLRYEDFVAEPRRHLEEIFDWVGLPGVAATFHDDGAVEMRISHNISGNPVRFRHGAVALRPDDAWKTEMPALRQRYVELLTWPSLGHFGYRR